MAASIEFTQEARGEFDAAFDWYAERNTKAATGFATEVDFTVNLIASDPQRHAHTFAGCQICRVRRYPYLVVYRDDGDTITVVAIAHTKRRPDYWRDRR